MAGHIIGIWGMEAHSLYQPTQVAVQLETRQCSLETSIQSIRTCLHMLMEVWQSQVAPLALRSASIPPNRTGHLSLTLFWKCMGRAWSIPLNVFQSWER